MNRFWNVDIIITFRLIYDKLRFHRKIRVEIRSQHKYISRHLTNVLQTVIVSFFTLLDRIPQVIELYNLTIKDSAVIQCNASNAFGYDFTNAFVNVMREPPYFVKPPQTELRAVDGHSVTLFCQTFSAPKALISWSKDGRPINGGRYRNMPNGDLFISVSTHRRPWFSSDDANACFAYYFVNVVTDILRSFSTFQKSWEWNWTANPTTTRHTDTH